MVVSRVKKYTYIGLFIVLGIMFQFLVHAGIEMWYIGKLIHDYNRYNFGLSLEQWVFIHDITAGLLLAGGAFFGLWEGVYWSKRMYSKQRTAEAHELPSIHYFFERAADEARRAKCLRARCGAIIVGGGRIIGRGYNAPPRDQEDRRTCCDECKPGKLHYDRTGCIHAEWRAIMDALRHHPSDLRSSRLYFTRVDENGKIIRSGMPHCTVCSRLALDAGISEFCLWHESGITIYTTDEYDRLSYEYGQNIKVEKIDFLNTSSDAGKISAILSPKQDLEAQATQKFAKITDRSPAPQHVPGNSQKNGSTFPERIRAEPPMGLPIG